MLKCFRYFFKETEKAMKKQLLQKLIKAVLCAVIVYLVTLFTGSAFPLPDGAYLHIGDAVVLALSLVMPLGTSLFAAVVGCAAADLTLGATSYVIATVITKAVMVIAVLLMKKLSDKPLTQDCLIAGLGLISVAGYFVSDFIRNFGEGFLKALSLAADGVPANILQALSTAVVYLVISAIVRKKVKRDDD